MHEYVHQKISFPNAPCTMREPRVLWLKDIRMRTIAIADAEPIIAEVSIGLNALVTADCIPILAAAGGHCAASAANSHRLTTLSR